MADQKAPQMQATLGLTGLTSNAMALIAPGAFLWLTFFIQATTGVAGQPSTAPAMWLGIFGALLLCLATAVAYAEISKLYPGTGSSYYYAEQALLSKDKAFKYARIAKFIVGWGSHLYYWVYPGVMVADHRHLCRLRGWLPLSELHQRIEPRTRVHGAGGRCLLVLRGVDRIEGRGRIDGCQPGDQRHSDLGTGRLQRAGARLSRQPPDGLPAGLPLRRPVTRHLHLSVCDRPKTARPCATRAAHPCRCSTQRASRFLHASTYPETDATGNFLTHPVGRIGDFAAQIQLAVHPGDGRHSDPGRI